MKKDPVPVEIRGIFPYSSGVGAAIFLGTKEKVFVIAVDPGMARVIGEFIEKAEKKRPLTHDLLLHVLKGFGITVERVLITDLRDGTFFARLVLQEQNELHTSRKIVEIDARPSDCLALAAAQKRPVFVSAALFESIDDASPMLEKLLHEGTAEPESGAEL